jgi:hypothetical protein
MPWWKNFVGLVKRGEACEDLKNIGAVATGGAVAAAGAICECKQ